MRVKCKRSDRKIHRWQRIHILRRKSRNACVQVRRGSVLRHCYHVQLRRTKGMRKLRANLLLKKKRYWLNYKLKMRNAVYLPSVKSANSAWYYARSTFIKQKHYAFQRHPNHVENMLVAHWWKI